MTAAMLVLEPIFEADLPPELYAYRPGRNAQQAVVEVEELLFRGLADMSQFAGPIAVVSKLRSHFGELGWELGLQYLEWLLLPIASSDANP